MLCQSLSIGRQKYKHQSRDAKKKKNDIKSSLVAVELLLKEFVQGRTATLAFSPGKK